jgi:DNA-binding CsgD family transcriptional regulator
MTKPPAPWYEGYCQRFPRHVYFARRVDGVGPIKIGCSRFVKDRMREIGYARGHKFEALACAPGGYWEERRMHRRFAHLRLDGEWFDAAPELLSLISEIARSGSLPLDAETREQRIARLYREGRTLAQVGADVGLTRERVRQILRQDLRIPASERGVVEAA